MFNISKETLERLRKEYPAGQGLSLCIWMTRTIPGCLQVRDGWLLRWMISELFTCGGIAVLLSAWYVVKTVVASLTNESRQL